MKKSQINWGPGFANTITIQYPADSLTTYSQPRGGSDFVQTLGGLESAWIVGSDYYLEATFRWIPNESTPDATGWEGASGWEAFLRYARAKNPFRWVLNTDSPGVFVESWLAEPMEGGPAIEMDGTKSIRITIRNPNTPYSS